MSNNKAAQTLSQQNNTQLMHKKLISNDINSTIQNGIINAWETNV